MCPVFVYLLAGGCGGGILIVNVSQEVKVDGTMSADGQPGSGPAGGGAGGSILILTDHFDGSGNIQVSGFDCDLFWC